MEYGVASGRIELREVEFAYPKAPEVKILKGINVTFQPGKKTPLVGESG